ncbi:hypothetical protein BASA81_003800 [Batrachochytrium salamandrivorans]|nr:hypothetical protein BASA81_003800 [Batrachochytrium salamandrivorans]
MVRDTLLSPPPPTTHFPCADALNQIQEKIPIRIPKTLIAVTASLGSFTTLYFSVGPGLLTNIFGFVFPAFASFKAIESVDKEDDTQWLMYWVVFAFFSLLETFADFLAKYIPMYFALKFAMLIWLSAPGTRGAEFVYINIVKPLFLENEALIDKSLMHGQKVVDELSSATKDVVGSKVDQAKQRADEIVSAANATATEGN